MIRADRFVGKVMVVTGAAQGIGAGVATRAGAEGASVVLADRADFVDDVAGAIVAVGGHAVAVRCDLETHEGALAAMQTAIDAFGRIDILVNNVGGTIWAKPYAHYAPHEIEAEVRRSLFPTLWCCNAVLPHLLANGGGVIVNVSSVATGGLNRVPYAAAKGGVNALTRALACEYAEHGIRVVATAPGGTDAPPRRVPRNTAQPSEQDKAWYQTIVDQTISSSLMHRYGTIDEQAAPILFLASDEASYVTGSVLPVAGGDLG